VGAAKGSERSTYVCDHEAAVEAALACEEGGQAGQRGVDEALDAALCEGMLDI